MPNGVQINHSGASSNLRLANTKRGNKNNPAVTSAARGAIEARRAELPSNRMLVPLEWLATQWVPSITSLESVHAWFAAKWRGLDALLRALVGAADAPPRSGRWPGIWGRTTCPLVTAGSWSGRPG